VSYQETLDYLFSRLPMYQRQGVAAYKTNIGNIITASEILDNPHKKFKSIHIAGTNGKTSTSHMLASIFQEGKYKVGLYTSPHLKDFRERIKINGKMISKIEVINFVKKNKASFEKINLSFFEFTVILAFNYFAKKKVDIAIIETGLGGRLDSTNIISPELSIITNISLDHTKLLGNTIEKISKEKGGIIKPYTPVVIGRKQEKNKKIFEQIAQERFSSIIYPTHQNYLSDLKGNYQKENQDTAITAILELKKKGWQITKEDITKGLLNVIKNTGLLGRWQKLSKKPLIICDTGHNEDGIRTLIKQIKAIPYQNLHIVFGVVHDKNLNNILEILPQTASYYFCKANIPRAMNEKEIKKQAAKHKLRGESFSSVNKALEQAKKKAIPEDLIFVGGSTFIVAEAI